MLVVSITRLDRNTRVAPEVGALHDKRAARVLGIREGPIGVLGSSETLFQRLRFQRLGMAVLGLHTVLRNSGLKGLALKKAKWVPVFLSPQNPPLMDVLTVGLEADSSERTRMCPYHAAPGERVPVT
jgi:hypothetical protein